MQIIGSTHDGFDDQLEALLDRSGETHQQVDAAVREIIHSVRKTGDRALLDYSRQFDRLHIDSALALEFPQSRLLHALEGLPAEQRQALEHAGRRIHTYHEHQLQSSWEFTDEDGTRLGQRVTPLDRVGIYVPGGKAAYPSSVLMNALPAKVAGVGQVVMVVPTPGGEINELVLAAAALAGVDRVFSIGGAQAIAALAFGTETVPAVDKIVGPGNVYVASAKKQVFGQVGIDMIAGPSEVVVVCDQNAPADWVATDLLAQAEHDELAQSIAISTDLGALKKIQQALEVILATLDRADIARAALENQGALIHAKDSADIARIVNRIAPEHLELLLEEPQPLLDDVRHAGAIFIGKYSAEALGDYCAGPNHVLPTSGTARFSSPLGVYDFQKRTGIIHCSAIGASKLGRTASVLARAESLDAHARSAELRCSGGRINPSQKP